MSKLCCICESGVTGCTVYDFRMDDARTEIEWHFCRNCSLTHAVPLIRCALNREQFRAMVKMAGGLTFLTHEDFYNEKGRALQPMEAL